MIDDEILRTYHAAVVSLNKGDVLFHQGDAAVYFFIVRSGRIKMSNYSDDGREFVQGYFSHTQSFGEPPFFSGSVYPASAMAVERSEVWKIDRMNVLDLLRNNFEIHLQLTQTLGNRLVYKSTMLSELAIEEAGHRLLTLIRYLAEHQSEQMKDSSASVKLSFTRQQLADMTGLRVETVIRSIKTLEQKHRLEIDDDGKIIWTHPSK